MLLYYVHSCPITRGIVLRHRYKYIFILSAVFAVLLFGVHAHAADLLIIGDIKLKPVSDLVTAVEASLPYETSVKSPAELKNDPEGIVRQERARAVLALGQDALQIALALPESVPIIYSMVINPPDTKRMNMTGVYMATPVSEYIVFINRYFPAVKRVGVICEPATREFFCSDERKANPVLYNAANPYEFITALGEMRGSIDALLLLPQKGLLSQTAIEKAFIFSFREKVPVIGISEKYVKTGALFSLSFDPVQMEKQIIDMTTRVFYRGTAIGIPPSPPDKFNLYINRKTAEATGVHVPPALINMAEKVYP